MLVMEMSNKKQQIPAIRFNGFTDAWEQRKLSAIVKLFGGYAFSSADSNSYGIPWLKIANVGKNGIDWSSASYLPDNFWLDYEDFRLFTGDYVMALTRPIISHALKIAVVDKNALLNQRVAKLIFETNEEYGFQLLQRGTVVDRIESELAGTDPPNLGSGNLKNITISITSNNNEQAKIGIFFKKLDDTIALHQRQLENYKELKKLMLQKIFNRELCFKDENGNDYPEWEEIALKELGETFTGLSGKTKENFGKGRGKFVTYMNVFSNPIANLAMTENVEIKDGEKQNEVCYGDIFFTTSSETPDEVGMSSVWLSHESNVYLNSFCFGYRLNSESESKVISQFLGAQLRAKHIRKEIVLLAQGSTRFNISKAKLIKIPLYLPVIQEQQKIADFLSMLDVRIEQLSQKVELLKEQKKVLMQKMFV